MAKRFQETLAREIVALVPATMAADIAARLEERRRKRATGTPDSPELLRAKRPLGLPSTHK